MNPLGDFPTVHLCWLPEIKISAPKIKDFHTWQRHLLMTAIWDGGSHISGSADWRLFARTVSVLVSYAKQRDRLHAKHSPASFIWSSEAPLLFLFKFFFFSNSWKLSLVDVEWKYSSSSSSSTHCTDLFFFFLTLSYVLHFPLLWALLRFMLRLFYPPPGMLKWLEETLERGEVNACSCGHWSL